MCDNKAVLVTGGAGYIGSHVCKLLARSGYLPVCLDNLSAGHRAAVLWGPLVVADIADGATVEGIIRKFDISAVLHLADSPYGPESPQSSRNYIEENLSKSAALFDALLGCGIRDVVFSSTFATYGLPAWLPISEVQEQRPIRPYGHSKLAIEKVLQWYAKAYRLKSVSIRCSNVAGADPEGEIGEPYENEHHLIPLAIKATQPGEPPLEMIGADYPTADGTMVRDYVHVMDVAKAHIQALEYLRCDENPARMHAFNLGTGTGYSVKEIIAAVERATGKPVRKQEFPGHPNDAAVLIADAFRARSELNWIPEHSSLDEIVSTAWQWSLKLGLAA